MKDQHRCHSILNNLIFKAIRYLCSTAQIGQEVIGSTMWDSTQKCEHLDVEIIRRQEDICEYNCEDGAMKVNVILSLFSFHIHLKFIYTDETRKHERLFCVSRVLQRWMAGQKTAILLPAQSCIFSGLSLKPRVWYIGTYLTLFKVI